ncbi:MULTISPECIES: aldehyde dehydrogenase family protein [Kitasatospora]|uniref:Putative arylcarboxylate reductase component n=1 Tax=Kitasatospora setae (strain ATCC 33774 / DSM 43861 / JCM 3304 / KCC A-0304 / NBRC 14216 / KM-6054) TaxID=452652 RepID=E4N3X4_KITSK|nr:MULTISPECIES: aldehyde dehydrogenase family protein [Kitasatospora]BAJ31605.1 putative arylcarboxylate reductase component [Kitasatospora setae KM-6054]
MPETEPYPLDALGPRGPYRARNRETVTDTAGRTVAELSLVPRLFVTRALTALHRATPLPAERRLAALARAAALFRDGEVHGLGYERYERTVARVSGIPLPAVRSAADEIADSARRALAGAYGALPGGAVLDWRDARTRTGSAVWTRRGEVLAVNAAGNHPAPHALWLEALALGFRVAIRPSRREPFTPHRLVAALRAAGFGEDHVVLLPTDHAVAGELITGADLSLVYGGDEVVRRYAGDPGVLVQGPGRAKILLTAGTDWRAHLDTIVDSIAHHGGVKCVNATAVLVEGDPAPVARALAERLAALPSLPADDEKAGLPVQPLERARALERHLLERAQGTTAHLGGAGIVDELSDGQAVLRPAVFEVPHLRGGWHTAELPFPCVWVAPWTRADGAAALSDSLVVGVLADGEVPDADADLIEDLVADRTVANVYVGDRPTHWMDRGVPHDGYLGEFLMRSKTVIRG